MARCGGSGVHTGWGTRFCRDCMTAEQREKCVKGGRKAGLALAATGYHQTAKGHADRSKGGLACAATGYHQTPKGHEDHVKNGLAVPTEARDRGRMVGRGKTNFNRAVALRPDHPRASRRGFVSENMVVMEEHLKRYLVPGEIVVRRDRDHTDPPTYDNLILCASRAEAQAIVLELGFCNSPTTIERFLVDIILAEFPEVIEQQHFGRYVVDAYLPPPYHLAFEADGDYWHNRPGVRKKDRARDRYLLKEFGLRTIRITGSAINALRKGNGT